jgi:predicted ribosome quality control (RQC) complex YloA/Tae2 family protein
MVLQMAFDGIVASAVTQELREQLLPGRIEKIYQPEPDQLTFHMKTRTGKVFLLLSANSSHPRIHLIEKQPENPPAPYSFCMLLRKHLTGSRILDVKQVGRDRILQMEFESANELGYSVRKTLTIEIMGKHSNIILTDRESHQILDAIKRVSIDVSRERQILPGKSYVLPPSQGKTPIEQISQELTDTIYSYPGGVEKGLLTYLEGFSPLLCREIAFRLEEDGGASRETLQNLLVEIKNDLNSHQYYPTVYLDKDQTPLDYHVIPLTLYQHLGTAISFASTSQALEYYHLHKNASNRLKQKAMDLNKSLRTSMERLYLKKQRLLEDLERAKQADEFRLYGELITAQLHRIPIGSPSATLENYYDQTPITIPLDPKISPAKNAQQYFKKYGKLKGSTKEKMLQLGETEKDLEYLASVESFLEMADQLDVLEDIRKELRENGFIRKSKASQESRKGKPSYLHYVLKNGAKVLVGRNNKENDILTFRESKPGDYWFHAKDFPGAHVILRPSQGVPTELEIQETAAIAAYHSKGRQSGNVPVDYMPLRYVKKPNGAKPGMVIFTHQQTIYVDPLLPDGK